MWREIKRVAFTCKSRFCTSCGKIYKDNWVENFVNRIINYKHKHVVFTIPEDIERNIFKGKKITGNIARGIKDQYRRSGCY